MSMYRAVVGCVCLAAALTAAALAAEKQGSQGPVPPLDPVRQFEHIGIFTAEKKPDERFVAATKVWVTDFQKHPYRVNGCDPTDRSGESPRCVSRRTSEGGRSRQNQTGSNRSMPRIARGAFRPTTVHRSS